MDNIFIGLISGTSADGIDAIAAQISNDTFEYLGGKTFNYSEKTREEILELSQPAASLGSQRIDRLGHLDHKVGLAFAQAAQQLCSELNIELSQVKAIGSHGQTIRHRPQGMDHFSLQIGDPNVIAFHTGCTSIADFRRMDMAAGGQGAPLVPLFHQWLLGSNDQNRVILNLGGIANITWLPRNAGQVMGFDTGPASALLDYWINKHLGKAYDENGNWAASGLVHQELLKHMLADPYFKMPAPKSTGREYFDAKWLEQKLKGADPAAPEDIQATLAELSAITIGDHISRLPASCDQLLVCGGGFHNAHLIQRIKKQIGSTPCDALSDLGVPSDFIEATTFAWLAHQRLSENRLDYRSVTGAERPVLMGNIFRA
ncbi:MAG: anhydro-N-acetylmuramic acid kinase [Gammaproteobacteria bacterium]|nr:anhydro-N-acetylmuramic acid kinase [Gammaproteobacteria bacterium]